QQLCYVLVTFLHHHQADDGVPSTQPYADDPLGRPACVTDVALVEPYRLSRAGTEHDVGLAIGDAHCHEFVVVEQVHSHQASRVDVAVLADGGALDEAVAGGENEEAVGIEALERQDGLDVLVLGQGQDVADVIAARGALEFGKVEDALAVDAAPVAVEQQVIVGAAHQQDGVDVVLFALLGGNAAPAARLAAVAGQRGALDVALTRDGDYHRLFGDEVLSVEVLFHVDDLSAPRVTELLADGLQLVADDAPQLGLCSEDQLEASYLLLQFAVLLVDLLALETREPLQAHVEDGLCLHLGETELAHEALARLGPVFRRADQRDDGVEVVEGDEVALEDVGAFARLL